MVKEIEPGYFAVDTFEEIKPFYEKLFFERNVKTLYKVRNWREKFHPEFITKGEIYFSKPNELNDPFDIHKPIMFDVSVIETSEFLEKLIAGAPEMFGTNSGRDSEIAAENYLNDVIKKDPQSFFLKNYESMINDEWFNDGIGIFSLTYNIKDDQLWGYYGGGLKGFAVGFEPILLAETLFAQGFFVTYTDEIKVSGIINQSLKSQSEDWFSKNKRWQFESEFRFARVIEDQKQRKWYYKPEIVKEIVLGPRIPSDDEEQITAVWEAKYKHSELLKLKCDYLKGEMFLERIR